MNAAAAEKMLAKARFEKESALRSVEKAMKEVERLRLEADKAEAEQRAAAENRNRQRQALYAGGTSGSAGSSSNARSSSSSSSTHLSSALELEADSLAKELEEATQVTQLHNEKMDILFSVDLLGADTAPEVVAKPRSRLTVAFTISKKGMKGVPTEEGGGEAESRKENIVTDPGENDFIGLYLCGTPRTNENASSSHLALEYTDGKRSGEISLTLPSEELTTQMPHDFEVWYVHQSGRVLASRGPIHMRKLGKEMEPRITPVTPPPPPPPLSTSTTTPLTTSPPPPSTIYTTAASSPISNLSSPSITLESEKQHPGIDSSADSLPIILLDKMYPTANNSNNNSLDNVLQLKKGVRVYRPPFVLQKLVRISAYQVYIPLPRHMRTMRTGVDPLTIESENSCLRLPEKWSPGVAIEGDSSSDMYNGLHPTVHVLFELPQIITSSSSQSSHGVCAYDATVKEVIGTIKGKSISDIAALPRDLFRLSLRLQHRVERSKCTMRILSDHVILRLPMYYGGAALPDRPSSLISLEEMLSLRRQGSSLSCRECSNRLLHVEPSSNQDSVSESHPNGMRAFVLPSEYWLEWSDFWLCHESQMNVLIPDVDFGAMQGVLLVGETHLQAHPADFLPDSIYIRPIQVPTLIEPSLTIDSDKDSESNKETIEFAFCSIECSRCSSSLGTTHCAIPRAARSSPFFTLTPTLLSAPGGAFLSESSHKWNKKLSPDSDPVIRLHKDRISVPNDAELNESLKKVYNEMTLTTTTSLSSASRVTTPATRSKNALRNYSVCSRLAADLLAASHSRAQYKFLLVASDVDISATQLSMHQRYPSNICIALTLVNWNISIRGSTQHSEWSESESAVSGGGGGGGGGKRRWEPHTHPGADVPALQVLFHIITEPEISDSMAAALDVWQGSTVSSATAVPLLSDEIDTVTAVLLESCLLLPREAQTPPQIGLSKTTQIQFRVGFLPLLENIR